jgi:hypothetical protein
MVEMILQQAGWTVREEVKVEQERKFSGKSTTS